MWHFYIRLDDGTTLHDFSADPTETKTWEDLDKWLGSNGFLMNVDTCRKIPAVKIYYIEVVEMPGRVSH